MKIKKNYFTKIYIFKWFKTAYFGIKCFLCVLYSSCVNAKDFDTKVGGFRLLNFNIWGGYSLQWLRHKILIEKELSKTNLIYLYDDKYCH